MTDTLTHLEELLAEAPVPATALDQLLWTALPALIARVRELEGALCNARAQLKYLDDRFPTGSSAGVIGQIDAALANGEQ